MYVYASLRKYILCSVCNAFVHWYKVIIYDCVEEYNVFVCVHLFAFLFVHFCLNMCTVYNVHALMIIHIRYHLISLHACKLWMYLQTHVGNIFQNNIEITCLSNFTISIAASSVHWILLLLYLLHVLFILHCVNHTSNSVSWECLQFVVMLSSANMSKIIHDVYRPMNEIRRVKQYMKFVVRWTVSGFYTTIKIPFLF